MEIFALLFFKGTFVVHAPGHCGSHHSYRKRFKLRVILFKYLYNNKKHLKLITYWIYIQSRAITQISNTYLINQAEREIIKSFSIYRESMRMA